MKTKIKLCIPFYRDFEGAKSGLIEMKKNTGVKIISRWVFEYDNLIITVEPRKGTYPKGELSNNLISDNIAQCREDLVSGDFDKYFFIDSDIEWCFNDFVKLCMYEYDIVMAPYIGHVKKHKYQCGEWLYPGKSKERYSTDITGLKSVDWAGLGFACIKKQVFENLEYPYFRHQMVKDQDGLKHEIGEDYGFCLLAGRTGYKIIMDFDVKLKHREPPEIEGLWDF